MPSASTMIRSTYVCIASLRQNLQNHEVRRIWQKATTTVGLCASQRSLHTSSHMLKDDTSSKHPKKSTYNLKLSEQKTSRFKSANPEKKRIVINAAKSLPGDWTKTAEELLDRLQISEDGNTQPKDVKSEPEETPARSLLQTMEVARSFQGQLQTRRLRTRGSMGRPPIGDDTKVALPYSSLRAGRRQKIYTDLFDVPRLGIFDANKLKKEGTEQPVSGEAVDLWAIMDKENIRRCLGGLPKNGFEEMIQWTKEGKLWKFPIDNEADMDEERKYKFHDHVFLEKHLSQFPDKGPIRKFMELVVLGLSKNPWISVPEKIEHIQWFGQYFREKQSILEAAVGEQGKMKESSGQIGKGK